MPTLERVIARIQAEARVARARRRPGVRVGKGTRFGPGVSIQTTGGGSVTIGRDVVIGGGSQIVANGGHVHIADGVFIAGQCIVAAKDRVEIGQDSMLAEMVCVRDHDHDPDAPPRSGRTLSAPVRIGARVWLASKSSVVRGGNVDDDSVVGAHALVNRPIPARVVAVGVPAKVVRSKA